MALRTIFGGKSRVTQRRYRRVLSICDQLCARGFLRRVGTGDDGDPKYEVTECGYARLARERQ